MRSQTRSSRLRAGRRQSVGVISWNSSVWVRLARSTWPLSLGERGGRTKSRQPTAELLAGMLEVGGKLASAVDLHRADGERHAGLEGGEELGGGGGGGAGADFEHVPAGDDIAGGELLEHEAREGTEVEGIHLDQVAGPKWGVFLGFAHGPGTHAGRPAGDGHAAAPGFGEAAASLGLGQDAADHGDRQLQALAGQQDGELVFAPARIAAAESQHRIGVLGRPGRLAAPPGAARAVLELGQSAVFKTPLPAIEGLPADAEVAAGERGVAAMAAVPFEPFQPHPRRPAQFAFLPEARQLARLGDPLGLHAFTLPSSVTHHSERTHWDRGGARLIQCRAKEFAPMTRSSSMLLALAAISASLAGQAVVRYQQPTAAILKVMEAPRPPRASVSPTRDYLLLMDAVPNPDIADLAQPMLRIAGIRIDPATNGLHATRRVKDFRIERIADGSEKAVPFPAAITHATAPIWAPNGRSFVFTNITAHGIQLWTGDVATGAVRQVAGVRINAVMGAPCQYLASSTELICKLVPAGRGAAPREPAVPSGPTVSESQGRAVPAPTYEDLLKNPHDEDLFDYYATAQLARVNLATGAATAIGKPRIFAEDAVSPDGRHLLVARIHRPYSYLVPDSQFPRTFEVWSLAGARERLLEDQPLGGTRRRGLIDPGPRGWSWAPMAAATIQYEVALDGGDANAKVPFHDRVM